MYLAQNLKYLREKNGETQKDISKLLSVISLILLLSFSSCPTYCSCRESPTNSYEKFILRYIGSKNALRILNSANPVPSTSKTKIKFELTVSFPSPKVSLLSHCPINGFWDDWVQALKTTTNNAIAIIFFMILVFITFNNYVDNSCEFLSLYNVIAYL